ncbi:MAG: hypothetical protein JW743_11250 [Deltaproteobacteria bacterium]|nr:hypothetical protein [Deltaproteobacteria bacterium]MBN2846169.1 hypothetical protein [Deltaproteobacteria bacterium]
MSADHERGIIDGANRVLKVLLKRPVVKNNIRAVLSSVDSDNARELARTILWEDPEIVLSLMGAVPALANVLVRFLDEVIFQVREKFPPELLREFISAVLQDVDRESITRIRDNLSTMIQEGYFQYDPENGIKGKEK